MENMNQLYMQDPLQFFEDSNEKNGISKTEGLPIKYNIIPVGKDFIETIPAKYMQYIQGRDAEGHGFEFKVLTTDDLQEGDAILKLSEETYFGRILCLNINNYRIGFVAPKF